MKKHIIKLQLIKSVLLLLFFNVFTISFLSAARTDTTLITELGEFIPDIDDFDTRAINYTTINAAIETLGQAGGGILKIPAGIFYIGPNLVEGATNNPTQAIWIDYDNITICGAGMHETVLRTNGTFVAKAFSSTYLGNPVNPGGRANGIRFGESKYINNPRKNIVLKDFELDGQAGWTGNYTLDYVHGSDKGWDMWHKGILTSGGEGYVDSITFENFSIHHYRGELLYTGGEKMGKLHMKNCESYGSNASTCNLHASEMLIEDCEFGKDSDDPAEDCRFWIEITGRHYFSSNQTNKVVFRNNVFRGGNTAGAIAICQGDFREYEIEFYGNDMDVNGNDLFSIMGGIHGPVKIHDNVINNVGIAINGNILGGGIAPGAEKRNSNVYFENNTITEGRALISFAGPADHFYISNNSFSGKSAKRSHSVMWVCGDDKVNFYYDNVIEGNSFTNCMYPRNRSGWPAIDYDINTPVERPLMINNIYDDANMTKNEGETIDTISYDEPKVQPNYEEAEIYAAADGVVVDLDVFAYPDGQVIKVYGGTSDKKVKFAKGNSTYIVNEDMFLDGTNEYTFRYIKNVNIWIEESSDNHAVTGVSLDKNTAAVFTGNKLGLIATTIPAYAANINMSWKSSDTSVVSVDETGVVRGESIGSATITVTTEDGGKTATCIVTVVDPVKWGGVSSQGLKVTHEVCGAADDGRIVIDESYVTGGTGEYAYSFIASKGTKTRKVEVDDGLFGTNYIQASNVFSGLDGTGGIVYNLTIYDLTDMSLQCNTNSYGSIIGVVVFGPAPLEMVINTDGVTVGDNPVGQVTVDISGGNGGIDNMYGTNKINDGLNYNVTIKNSDNEILINTVVLKDNETSYSFKVPADEFVIQVGDEKGCIINETVIVTTIISELKTCDVNIYPNPTKGMVNVDFIQVPEQNTLIRVLNPSGQLVSQKQAISLQNQIDLSNQTPGLYFLNISGSRMNETIKVIVR